MGRCACEAGRDGSMGLIAAGQAVFSSTSSETSVVPAPLATSSPSLAERDMLTGLTRDGTPVATVYDAVARGLARLAVGDERVGVAR